MSVGREYIEVVHLCKIELQTASNDLFIIHLTAR
jgi:hypothetical protein